MYPKIHLFIKVTRSVFPKADIRLVTSGLLIPNAS